MQMFFYEDEIVNFWAIIVSDEKIFSPDRIIIGIRLRAKFQENNFLNVPKFDHC